MIQTLQILIFEGLKKYLITNSTIWMLAYHLQNPCHSGDLWKTELFPISLWINSWKKKTNMFCPLLSLDPTEIYPHYPAPS